MGKNNEIVKIHHPTFSVTMLSPINSYKQSTSTILQIMKCEKVFVKAITVSILKANHKLWTKKQLFMKITALWVIRAPVCGCFSRLCVRGSSTKLRQDVINTKVAATAKQRPRWLKVLSMAYEEGSAPLLPWNNRPFQEANT